METCSSVNPLTLSPQVPLSEGIIYFGERRVWGERVSGFTECFRKPEVNKVGHPALSAPKPRESFPRQNQMIFPILN